MRSVQKLRWLMIELVQQFPYCWGPACLTQRVGVHHRNGVWKQGPCDLLAQVLLLKTRILAE